MRRTGARGSGEFKAITWEEAYDRIAEVLQHSRARSKGSEIMRIGGSGSCRGALHNTATLSQRFLSLVGDYTDTRGNYSSEVVDFVNPYLFGTNKIGIDVRTIRSSSCVILWGYNPFDTRFGCEAESVFRELRSTGTPCYVIDPRKTASVALCGGTWVGIRPGTDSFLAAACAICCLPRILTGSIECVPMQKGLTSSPIISPAGSTGSPRPLPMHRGSVGCPKS